MYLLLLAALALAPVQRPADVVKWSASGPASPVAPGSVARIIVSATIAPGWKLYAIEQTNDGPRPLAFAVAKDAPFEILRKQIVAPRPMKMDDVNFSTETRYYENEARITLPVTVRPSAAAGRQPLPLEVTFQACGADICLRPFTQKLDVEIEVRR